MVFVQPMKRDLHGQTLKLAERAHMTEALGDWEQIVGAPLPTSELRLWKNATNAALIRKVSASWPDIKQTLIFTNANAMHATDQKNYVLSPTMFCEQPIPEKKNISQ